MLAPAEHEELKALALRVRAHAIRLAGRGGCFLGASLSCADLLVYLYRHGLRISPERLADPQRDYLLLSKGHDVPALYGTLIELGYLDTALLDGHLKPDSHVYWHPNRHIPGVEFHSGSLGHLLSVGLGIALGMRQQGARGRVFVLLGDGELNEGSVWEALLVARAHGLTNLVPVVDRNRFQANGPTESIVPLEPLDAKLQAFGYQTLRFDGHDFAAIDAAFGSARSRADVAHALIADTVRNRGLPSIENLPDRWFVRLTSQEVEALLRELAGGPAAKPTSPALTVR